MDLSDLPKIVIAVNISCCNACYDKLTKLLTKLLKTKGAVSFDIDTDGGLVTVKGNTDPGNLVKSISKAICKKKTRLVLYEIPEKKATEKEAEGKKATNGKEKAKESEGKKATNGKGKAKETEGKKATNEKGKAKETEEPAHQDPAHHYFPGPTHYGPALQDGAHQYYPGPTHYGPAHQYFPGPNNHPMNRFEPIRYDMMPPQQYGYPYPPNDYYGEREGRVSSTNNVCDYFSDENASACAIM